MERGVCGVLLRSYPVIFLQGLKKTTKTFEDHTSRCRRCKSWLRISITVDNTHSLRIGWKLWSASCLCHLYPPVVKCVPDISQEVNIREFPPYQREIDSVQRLSTKASQLKLIQSSAFYIRSYVNWKTRVYETDLASWRIIKLGAKGSSFLQIKKKKQQQKLQPLTCHRTSQCLLEGLTDHDSCHKTKLKSLLIKGMVC